MITGHTKLFAVIANPVAHVRTPQALNALFEKHGIDAVLVPIEVAPENFAQAMETLSKFTNFGGAIITVPHKTAAIAHCARVPAPAVAAGAVNVIRREADGTFTGDLLDGDGFVAGMAMEGIEVKGRKIFLAGAGGAASAIAFALAKNEASHITISNRSIDRSQALAQAIRRLYPAVSIATTGSPAGHEIAINATSLGLKESDPMPFDPQELASNAIVAEVIMQPEETKLLAVAKACGLRVHLGKWMLEGQVIEILRFLHPEAAKIV